MATVPVYDNFQTSVAQRPAAQFQGPSGPQAGAIAADQLSQTGRALTQLGGEAARIALQEQQKADDLRITDARNQLDRIKTDRQLKALTLTGRAALERPDGKSLMDEEAEELDKASQQILSTLGNERQKQAFTQYTGQLTNHYRGQLGGHVIQQQKQFDQDTDNETLNGAYRTAGMLYGDANEVAISRAKVDAVIAKNIERNGLDPSKDKDMIDGMRAKMLSPLHAAVLTGFIKNDPSRAEDYYNQHSAEMTLQAKVQFQDAVGTAAAEQRGTGKVQELMAAAGNDWNLRDIDRQLAETFKGKPQDLKYARAELQYQDKLRDDAVKNEEKTYLGPVDGLIGNAINAGRPISKQEVEQYVKPILAKNPELYRKAADAVDKHNDEIRREGFEAQSRARSLAESSPDKALNYIALKMDMVRNPTKYRAADMASILRDPVRKGSLSTQQANSLTDIWVGLQKPEKQAEMATLVSADNYLDMRLAGVVVDGRKYTELPKDKQAEIKNQARAAAEPLLQAYQAQTGGKADKVEVQGVIDTLFTNKTYRSTIFGQAYGAQFTEGAFDPAGATGRLSDVAIGRAVRQIPPAMRSRITNAIKANGGTPTDALILDYYNSRPQ